MFSTYPYAVCIFLSSVIFPLSSNINTYGFMIFIYGLILFNKTVF